MAPLNQAISAVFSQRDEDGKARYEGIVDGDWTIGQVPNGGYVLALMLEAATHEQSQTTHPDPLHVTSHFLQSASVGPFKVELRVLRKGRGFTNILADLIQEDSMRITTHMIFGSMSEESDEEAVVIPPEFTRRVPLTLHPAQVQLSPTRPAWTFATRGLTEFATDIAIRAQNRRDSPNRTTVDTIGGGGFVSGAYFGLKDPNARITPPMLAFLADVFENTPSILTRLENKPYTNWYPTMVMTVEFKAPLPKTSSNRTVGIYTVGRFVSAPQSRHETFCELWSAPSNIGEGPVEPDWRENQVCLAVATQMALVVPMARNLRRGQVLPEKRSAKL